MTAPSNEIDRLKLDIGVAHKILDSSEMDIASKQDCVQALMLRLEEFAGVEPTEACCLMTSLWPLADELFMHDVCNGVDLWIENNQSPALFEHLDRLSIAESEPNLKRHWEGLISNFI